MTPKDPNLWGQGGVLAAVLAFCVAMFRAASKLTGARVRVVDPDCERQLAELGKKYDLQGEELGRLSVKYAVAEERISSLERRNAEKDGYRPHNEDFD